MIKNKCFEIEHIKKKSQEIKTDPILIERAIYAFELLSLLIERNIPLVFKGGTSLMLLIPEFNRLSIDIDIVTDEREKTLENTFNNITKAAEIFKRWDEDIRVSGKEVPKRHFKFYYDSPIERKELYVLLDILQRKPAFPSIITKPILNPIFEVEKKINVSIPSINSLAGDKLTAFAPRTIGILFGKEKSMEIIKQLFDLGLLFEYITDLKEVLHSYENIATLESRYRELNMSTEQFLNDSIETLFLLCQMDFRGSAENDYTEELKEGIRKIRSHALGGSYSFLKAKEDASKVVCLASLIKEKRWDIDITEVRRDRNNLERIRNISLPKNYNILNKLKRISPKSFYFWAVALKAIK
ncbi:MAG: hypothetical protein GQ476_02530 [Candidatus Aminicenantes bacterium]|nr:hypothetical protein [Candidatus Aminicenantes bacterium]